MKQLNTRTEPSTSDEKQRETAETTCQESFPNVTVGVVWWSVQDKEKSKAARNLKNNEQKEGRK